MATHLSRIAALEDSHAQLSGTAASTKDVDALRAEYRKLLDSEHVDLLSLRAHVWGLGASRALSFSLPLCSCMEDIERASVQKMRVVLTPRTCPQSKTSRTCPSATRACASEQRGDDVQRETAASTSLEPVPAEREREREREARARRSGTTGCS